MNDQPLNDEELDIKIRSLVATAVADAPAARPLPTRVDAVVREMKKSPSRRGYGLAGLGVAASLLAIAVVWSNHDDNDQRVIPAAIVSAPTTDTPPTTVPATTVPSWSLPWPAELAVIIASERGIERVTAGTERVTAEHGMSVVTRLDEPLLGDVAFETVDGEIVSGETLMDVAIIDERLDVSGTVDYPWVNRSALDGSDEEVVKTDFVPGIARLTHGLDILVGQSLEENGTYRPILLHTNPGNNDQFWVELGIAGPFGATDDSPRLFSVSPTGSTIGWVDGDQFVLADGRSFKIPEGSTVVEVDLIDTFVALTRAEGNGQMIDLSNGDAFPVPAAGRVTISLAPVAVPPQPPDTTTPVVTPEPIDVSSTVVTAGPDGVWRVVDGVATQLTSEAMSMALQLPDGSVIMQRQSGWSREHAATNTTLLVLRNGQIDELFPGEAVEGWVRLHDVAMVNGETTVLYAVEQEASPQASPTKPAWMLFARSLTTFESTVVAIDISGWERAYSRMHLAETGVIVGELYQEARRQLVSYSIGEPLPISPLDIGLEEFYSDCTDCPRLYTVRRDGTMVAWLDGTMLHIATPDLTAEEEFDLGDAALNASDLELGNGFVVLSFGGRSSGTFAPPVIDFNKGAASAIELPGASAAIVTVPTPPWQIDEDLTAALQGQDFDTVDALFAAVEAQIEAIRYAAVEPVEPITFTRGVLPNELTIAAPNFDDSVPQTWYRIVPGLGGYGQFHVIGSIESVGVCRDGTYSTPTHLCV